jgi:UTP-glucose-1-phosphate uridylyltransferase
MLNHIEFIIPCGGKSTRNYPHSKSVAHKSLLPFGDGRLIDHVLQDIIRMGGRHITIVCSNQATIELFKEALGTDKSIEDKLRAQGRIAIADALAATFLPEDVDLKFVVQSEPIGTAHVLGLAHRVSPNRHGVMIFPDDIIVSKHTDDTHIKRLVDTFLSDEKQILLTGVEQENVSNNAILHEGRLIEKPSVAYNHIAGYSPIIVPKAVLDFITKQVDVYEQTGKLPEGLKMNEWVYTDGINQFLDADGETNGYYIKMFPKKEEDILLDTGTLPLYEKAQLRALLHLSRFQEENRSMVKALLAEV